VSCSPATPLATLLLLAVRKGYGFVAAPCERRRCHRDTRRYFCDTPLAPQMARVISQQLRLVLQVASIFDHIADHPSRRLNIPNAAN